MFLSASKTIRLAQITDPHLGKQPGDELLGVNTDLSLQDVLSTLPEHDLLIASGDISNDGSPESYRRFADTLTSQGISRFACLPGNHDEHEVMARVMGPAVMNPVLVLGSWIFILLNSRVPGFEYGDLSESELKFLDKTLGRHPNHHAMIFLHHQPVKVGSAWIDQYLVRSADRFFNILDQHSNVRGVAWGHVHQDFHEIRNGVELFASPSTCIQFKPNNDQFALDDTMPGYRMFNLQSDGGITTSIGRVEGKNYNTDFSSSGY